MDIPENQLVSRVTIPHEIQESSRAAKRALRDQFAMAALQGICASGPGRSWNNADLASEAWCLADAMMEERKRRQGDNYRKDC